MKHYYTVPKIVSLFVASLFACFFAMGQEFNVELLRNALRDATDSKDYEAKIAQIEGLTPQGVVECKLLWAKMKEDHAYYNQLEKPDAKTWKRESAFYFDDVGALESLEWLMKAFALRDEDKMGEFKQAILEAYWLNPTDKDAQAEVTKYYEKRKNELITVPMDATLLNSDGQNTSLAEFAEGQRAIYMQVWATWCQPCIAQFPSLKRMAQELPAQGVSVLALNNELSAPQGTPPGGNMKGALEKKNQHAMDLPWLVEPEHEKITGVIDIRSVPHALLLTPNGKILWKGHPADDSLQLALKKLGIEL